MRIARPEHHLLRVAQDCGRLNLKTEQMVGVTVSAVILPISVRRLGSMRRKRSEAP